MGQHLPDMLAERRADLAGVRNEMNEAGADERLQLQ
jgi:hypothetical protein